MLVVVKACAVCVCDVKTLIPSSVVLEPFPDSSWNPFGAELTSLGDAGERRDMFQMHVLELVLSSL